MALGVQFELATKLPASHIVMLREGDEHVAQRLVDAGWDRAAFGPGADVIGAVCPVDGVVLWPVGAFDDVEAGAAV